MLDTGIEYFTAAEAVEAGLIGAIKRKEVEISGGYRVEQNGNVLFRQKPFTFVDKNGTLRIGKFEGKTALLKFFAYLWSLDNENTN